MPSSPRTRQVRLIAAVAILIVVVILYVTSSARATRDAAFYQRTQVALKEQARAAEQARADADVSRRLQAAEERAKQRAEERAAERAAQLAAERAGAPAEPVRKPAGEQERRDQGAENDGEEVDIEAELTAILQKSPIVIFSKTYCPFSMKAKQIFRAYKITPAPVIVELNEHPLGPQLQSALGTHTGRRTVPNILVNGQSIGGGDDVEQLHEDGQLVATVKLLGKKRISEMKLV